MKITADGNYPLHGYVRRLATLAVFGTFGSGTVALEASFDNGSTWLPVKALDGSTDVKFTANGYQNFMIGAVNLRLSVTGSTNPDLEVHLTEIQNSWR